MFRRALRSSRRTRLIILAVLAPVALVAWQANAATGVQVAAQRTQDATSENWTQTKRLVEERSDVLADFYASPGFDPYVETWLAAQPSTRDYEDQCSTAEGRVFLPPFTSWVSDSCSDLLGGGEVTRLSAFTPILTRFLRACRDNETPTNPPYDDAQWAEIDRIVDLAAETDCKQEPPVNA